MKKKILSVLITILAVCTLMFTMTACTNKVEFKINFVVDGEVYAVINTNGEEIIKMPQDPSKEDYNFDGWFWDKDVWEKPFTANSLLDAPLSSDMNVYAKFTKNHTHEYGAWVSNGDGTHTKTCANDNTHKITEDCTFDSNKSCKECGYIITTLSGTEISSDVYTINGTNLNVKVPNKQTNFAFAETINVAEGATYKVYTDIQCKEESNIPSYMVNDLVVGNNTYYFLVSNEGSFPKIYTVTVRRRPMYDVTFIVNGGTAVDKQVIEEDSFATVPVTTKTGYTFDGWDYDFTVPITQKTNITASWSINEYSITYKLNGGENNQDNVSTYNIETETITLLAPTKTNYTFNGWFTEETFENQVTKITLGSFGDKVFYAKWTPIDYDITYKLNGGTNDEFNVSTYNIETETITLLAPMRAGYTFTGWFTSETFEEGTEISQIVLGSYGDITLYAKWEANLNTLHFDGNGATSGSMSDMQIRTDATATLSANEFVCPKPGYAFAGWSTTKNGSVVYSDGATYTMGTESEYTLYAVWTRIEYTITYMLNGGTNNRYNIASYNIESETITLLDPERIGYSFVGWYTTSSFTVSTQITSIPQGSTGNKTFYAKWQANLNTLHFDGNGATSGSMSDMQIRTDATATLSVNNFSRIDGRFIGWSTTKNGSVVYSDGATYTMGTNSSYTLYAVWERVFTVSGNTITGLTTVGKTLSQITIPTTIDGANITTIGSEAFKNCRLLTSITIPNSVTYIGEYAFFNCESLTSVVIGDSVTSIGDYAFANCYKLVEVINKSTHITVEKGSSSNSCVGNFALAVYNSDSGITESQLVNDNGYIIYTNGNEKILVGYNGQATDLVLPNYVTKINDSAFYNCDSLTSIVMPNSVTSIGDSAFRICSSLTSVTIGDSVTSIGAWAFSGCSSLTSITISNSVTYIGDSAFLGCRNLTVYTEWKSRPSGWDSRWNFDYPNNTRVVWGYTNE